MNGNGVSKNTIGSSNARRASSWVTAVVHVLKYGAMGRGQVNELSFEEGKALDICARYVG